MTNLSRIIIIVLYLIGILWFTYIGYSMVSVVLKDLEPRIIESPFEER